MEIAGATEVDVVDDGLGLGRGGSAAQAVGQDGSDALVGVRTYAQGPRRDGFDAAGFEVAEQPQDTESGSKALLGMRAMREDGGEQCFGVRADGPRPAPEAVRRPFGVAAMRARHVVGIGAMPRPPWRR